MRKMLSYCCLRMSESKYPTESVFNKDAGNDLEVNV